MESPRSVCQWGKDYPLDCTDRYTRMDHKDTQGILYVLIKSFFLSFHCDHSWNLSMIKYENKYCNILSLLYFQIICWPPEMAPFQSNLNRHTNAPILMFCLYSLIMYSGLTQGLYWTWVSWKFFSLAGPPFCPLRLDHNFVSSNWAKPSWVKFKGLLIFRAIISIISIVIYVLICPTYYVDTWVSYPVHANHSSNHSSMKPLS